MKNLILIMMCAVTFLFGTTSNADHLGDVRPDPAWNPPAESDSFVTPVPSLYIGLTSHHFENCGTDCAWNEKNSGFGLQVEMEDNTKSPIFLAVGKIRNSIGTNSWYVGGGQHFQFGSKKFHVSPGYFLGFMTYPLNKPNTTSERESTAVILPLLDIGTENIAVVTTYVPKVSGISVASILFQLRVQM